MIIQIVVGIIVAVIVLSLLPLIIELAFLIIPILLLVGAVLFVVFNPESLLVFGVLIAIVVLWYIPFFTLRKLREAVEESGNFSLWLKGIKLRLMPALSKSKKEQVRSELKLLADKMQNERTRKAEQLVEAKNAFKASMMMKEASIVEKKIKRVLRKFWRISDLSVDYNGNEFEIYFDDDKAIKIICFKIEVYVNSFIRTPFLTYRSHSFKYTIDKSAVSTYGEHFENRSDAMRYLKKTIGLSLAQIQKNNARI